MQGFGFFGGGRAWGSDLVGFGVRICSLEFQVREIDPESDSGIVDAENYKSCDCILGDGDQKKSHHSDVLTMLTQ